MKRCHGSVCCGGEKCTFPKLQVTAGNKAADNIGCSYGFPSFPSSSEAGDSENEEIGDEASSDLGDVEEVDEDSDGKTPAPTTLPHVTAASQWEATTMTAAQFASLGEQQRKHYRLYRATGFEYLEQHVPTDPYFPGLWLGRRETSLYNSH